MCVGAGVCVCVGCNTLLPFITSFFFVLIPHQRALLAEVTKSNTKHTSLRPNLEGGGESYVADRPALSRWQDSSECVACTQLVSDASPEAVQYSSLMLTTFLLPPELHSKRRKLSTRMYASIKLSLRGATTAAAH
ncbi:hypothetical protein BGZ63DRAFT_122073 [Mariannaea sp. PMI_226]|nr:hypothetical protein BGZ63DRAFT_122073 [Mariannaea sp. PMI_226]